MSITNTLRALKERLLPRTLPAKTQLRAYAILDDHGRTWFLKATCLEKAGERFLEERVRCRQPFPRPECGAGPPLWVRYETATYRIIVTHARHVRNL